MKSRLAAVLLLVLVLSKVNAQKISDTFNPIIKQTPNALEIVAYDDNSYLVYGDFHYYGNELCGSLIKVDDTGKLVTDFQKVFTDRTIESLIVLPDGKILIQGTFHYLNGKKTAQVVRLNADGSVDPTFAADPDRDIREMVVQSTGKVVVLTAVGVYHEAHRLNTDGTEDNSFINPVVGYKLYIIRADGDKIYVSNTSTIFRMMPDGTIDNTFAFVGEPSKSLGQLSLQADGKLIAVVSETTFTPSFSTTHTLKRYHPDGSADNSFNAGLADQSISGCVVRKSGRIAIAGLFSTFDSMPGAAFELNSDGSVNRKLLTTDYNGIHSISEDSNGNIFVTGGFKKANDSERVKFIAKLTATNALDLKFKLPVTRGSGSILNFGMAVQSTGKLILGGEYYSSGVADDSSKLVRVLRDGTVDPTFQPAINKVSIALNPTSVWAIAVQPDDKLIVGGQNIFTGGSRSLGRLLPDGQIDNTFQTGTGLNNSNYAGSVQSILVKDSKIYVLGFFNSYNGAPCQSLVILNENGGMIGPQQHSIPPNSYFQDMAIQPDGKIVIMGDFNLSPTDNRKFLRLNTDGSIDTGFELKTILGNLLDLEIDHYGNILVTGNYMDYNAETVLKRFNSDGQPDPTLNLGSGFQGGQFLTAYFAKALENDVIAIGGNFDSYNGNSSPALVLIDQQGSRVSMENSFAPSSYLLRGVLANDILYATGGLSDRGQNMKGAAKVVFPIDKVVSNYEGRVMSDSTMSLSWEGNFLGADRIVIESSSPDASNFSVVATVAPNVHTYELKDLTEVTPYHIRIRGMNDSFASPYLTLVDTTYIIQQESLPPTNVTANSFVANWKSIPGTDAYEFQLSDNNFVSLVKGYEARQLTTASLAVDDLDEGKTYQYRVKRFKNKKSSEYSKAVAVNIITGVERSGTLSVNVYPNPVADQLFVELPENVGEATVVIHSIEGKLVGQYSIINGNTHTIDAQVFPEGIYIMTVSSKENSRKFKLARTAARP